jgi:iron complex outermembrane receptor protein
LGYNVDKPTVSGTFTFGEKWGATSLSLPLSVFEWRGQNGSVQDRYAPGVDGHGSEAIQQGVFNMAGHGVNFGPRWNWKISDDESVTWQSFLQRGVWNYQSAYANTVLMGLPTLEDNGESAGTWQSVRSNVQWVNHFSSAERMELKAGVNASRGTFDNQTVRDGLPQRHGIGDNGDAGLTQAGNYSRLLNDEHTVTVGWDLEWRQRDEKRDVTEKGVPQIPDVEGQPFSARIERQAMFIQDEWEINKQWSTYLGLRGERIATQSQGMDAPVVNTSSVFTPMWHLKYKVDPAGRDLVRASVTRSYKAPDMGSLLARPTLNSLFTDTTKTNTELSPDRLGNPDLLPELATGLDIAFEKYLAGGGLVSVGVFYRSINNLIRSVTSLQTVAWAGVPRWVSQPTNFSKAQTSGLELEVKGRAGELFPALADAKLPLNLRAALNFYQSNVDALPGPNNRLDGQQPWSGTFGVDYRLATLPVNLGANLAFTPGYTTQQTLSQTMDQSRVRSLDVFAQMVFSKSLSMRVSANNVMPVDTQTSNAVDGGYGSSTLRSSRTNFNIGAEIKL